jgi:nitrile hydratase
MNGVHDMGGMQGFGPIAPEKDEPVFHEDWEKRALVLTLAMAAWRRWTLDGSRHARELIPPAEYLRMSYYEKWFTGLVSLMTATGLVSAREIETGKSAPGAKATPPLRVADAAAAMARGAPTLRTIQSSPRFAVGEKVCARNIHPLGHTRLPRYARGKPGTVTLSHGAHVFPDANAHGKGEAPQHLYQVRFEAKDLWGESGTGAVYIDLWEDYLEPDAV